VWEYNQSSNELKLLESELWFPKGIAMNDEDNSLYISNSLSCNIVQLHPDRVGQFSIVAENLPVHPAGLSVTSNSS